jgi:hypothetical protein
VPSDERLRHSESPSRACAIHKVDVPSDERLSESPSRAFAAHIETIAGRMSRKIRGLDDICAFFQSWGNTPLEKPPVSEMLQAAQESDLFVHSYGQNNPQVWILSANGEWTPIEIGHNHPSRSTHYLTILENGQPGWVIRHTLVTYKTRRRTPR